MQRVSTALALSVFWFFSLPAAFADSLRTIDQLIDQTTVAITGSGKVWAMRLTSDGRAVFLYSDKSLARGRWNRPNDYMICIKFPSNPQEICKYTSPAGRGLHWWTVGAKQPSSQLLTTISVNDWPQTGLIHSVSNLVGKRVHARTKDNKNIWYAEFMENMRFRFARVSTSDFDYGSYRMVRDHICLRFDGASEEHCRSLQHVNGQLRWSDTSMIVYVEDLYDNSSQTIASAQPSSNATQRQCSSSQRNELKSACNTIWF